jgi:peptidoglycan/LPS O-acetylase OafA/YrhL
MAQPAREPCHFAYIDAVRGYAFLAVLCVHCAYTCGSFPGSDLAMQGGYGVQLFFLASAITLSLSMAMRRERKSAYSNFFLRRFFRIAPLFWAGIFFYWGVPNVLPASILGQFAPQGVHASYFVLTALFLHGWHPYTFNSIVPGGWSIAVEMMFYLVFPFCFDHISTLRRAATWLFCGSILTLFQQFFFNHLKSWIWPEVHEVNLLGFFLHLWFPSQFIIFLTGIFAYFLLEEPVVQKLYVSRFWSCWLFAVSAMLLLSLLHHPNGGSLSSILIALALSGIIISFAGNSVPLVVNPLIRNLGKISYSCYLTHFAALALVVRAVRSHFPGYFLPSGADVEMLDTGNSMHNLGAFVLIGILTLLVTVIFSTITYHLIENPGIALGRSIIRRLDPARKASGKK